MNTKIETIDRIMDLLLRGDILNDRDNFALIKLLEELKGFYAARAKHMAEENSRP